MLEERANCLLFSLKQAGCLLSQCTVSPEIGLLIRPYHKTPGSGSETWPGAIYLSIIRVMGLQRVSQHVRCGPSA